MTINLSDYNFSCLEKQTNRMIRHANFKSGGDSRLFGADPETAALYRTPLNRDPYHARTGRVRCDAGETVLYEDIARFGHIATTYLIKVNGSYIMDPSPIPKFDNPKMDRMPALQLFGAGREKHIYAVPPYIQVECLDFDDNPFSVQSWDEPCTICGSTHSYLDADEVVLDDSGKRTFICSDTDYCRQQSEALKP